VIVLTGRGERDAEACIEAGADEYMTKPFRFDDLMRRVDAQVGATAASDDALILAAGVVRLDRAERIVAVQDRPVDLTLHEYLLVEIFLARPEEILTRSQLLMHGWGRRTDPDGNLIETTIEELHRKLAVDLVEILEDGEGFRLALS
jgi:DNA-binding response OmpR family regulator